MKPVYTAWAICRGKVHPHVIILALCAAGARGSNAIPLLKDCSNPDDALATVSETDRVQVHYGLGGNSQTCYAVTATVEGKTVVGYMLGGAHPDVAEFERDTRRRVPAIPSEPPVAAPAEEGPAT